jgi:hypothetical protein
MENFMSNSTSTFNFSPRPEAHPMKWADLQPPVQKAVRDLLLRIEGATRAVKAKETTAVKAKETTANCFLVYGDRGTGKTTVLLTAKDACDPQKNIFGEDEDKEDAVVDQVITLLCERGRVLYSMLKQQFGLNDKKLDELKIELIQHRRLATDEHGTELVWVVDDERLKTEILKDARLTAERFTVGRLTADARNSAKELKNYAVWLDVLDLEPLPSRANLLTTVLTRVRNALDLSGSDQQTSEASSILEESVKSSRHQLTQLINDATLMWEDISEPDTRNRANRQVAAADIYARFQKRFHEAIQALAQELGRRSGRAGTCRPIVLPIDNIDRSTEHLYSIVKLAQMMCCPELWLVMAGDRQDVDTYLERAYWKELIRIGETAGASGKIDVSGEDEAFVMARRQAATASHRLLPPSHRIEVQLLTPQETLQFKRKDVLGSTGYPPKPGHYVTSITYGEDLMALSGQGQRIDLR